MNIDKAIAKEHTKIDRALFAAPRQESALWYTLDRRRQGNGTTRPGGHTRAGLNEMICYLQADGAALCRGVDWQADRLHKPKMS